LRRRVIEPAQENAARLLGARHDLDRELGQRDQCSIGAGDELAEVVAGDVLDDAPARLERLAAPADTAKAQEMIARRALLDAPRPREIAGDGAAERRRRRRRAVQRAPVAGLEG